MTALLGTYSLVLAVLTAAATILAAVSAARFDNPKWLALSRRLTFVFAALITLGSAVLTWAMLNSDFRIAYVASYSELALPAGYKLAAFWAGQEGSLLLWAWLLAVMSCVTVLQLRHDEGIEPAAIIATLAGVGGFFAALMLFAANPFAELPTAPADGRGLNPLLQDPGMIAHPPLLFIGYAGFTVPFALLVGAMLAGRDDNLWIARTRRWLLFSWLFLSLGILLGAQWAYVELGWGGYWAWDPVENASLLPWLTATALLHSIMPQQQRGMFKIWNAALISATFLLCIFGTYLTRSGVIQSVHAFGASLVGTFFLVFLLLGTLFSAVMIFGRRRLLRSEQPMEQFISKEGFFLATNILLVLITLVTLVGTIFPLISGVVGEPISVGQSFYNTVVIPLTMVLLALMTVGPLLVSGDGAGRRLLLGLAVPVGAAVVGVATALFLGLRDPWALTCAALAVLALGVILGELFQAVNMRQRQFGEGFITALIRLIDSNHRRYGGQLIHLGMILVMIGVAGSSLFGVKQDLRMTPGQTVQVGKHQVTFERVEEVRKVNFTAVQAHVVLTDGRGRATKLLPQMRFYDKTEQPNSEVALRTTLLEDVYVTLAGWEQGGSNVALQALVNPLVSWIWIGGLVLTLGGLFGLLPRFLPKPRPAGFALPLTATGRRPAQTQMD